MMQLRLGLGLSLIGVLLITGVASAAPKTSLKQAVLPEDCLFEIINDGTNRVEYLTPKECGQEIDQGGSPELDNGGSGSPTGGDLVVPSVPFIIQPVIQAPDEDYTQQDADDLPVPLPDTPNYPVAVDRPDDANNASLLPVLVLVLLSIGTLSLVLENYIEHDRRLVVMFSRWLAKRF